MLSMLAQRDSVDYYGPVNHAPHSSRNLTPGQGVGGDIEAAPETTIWAQTSRPAGYPQRSKDGLAQIYDGERRGSYGQTEAIPFYMEYA